MNFVKNISPLILVVLVGIGFPQLQAMIRPAPRQLSNLFMPLQELAGGHVGEVCLIEKAFSDSFGLICEMTVNDFEHAKCQLKSPELCLEINAHARRLTEQIHRDYAYARLAEIGTTAGQYQPLERFRSRVESSLCFTLLGLAVDIGRERLHKKIEALTCLVDDIIAGRLDHSSLDNAQVLRSTVEFQVDYQPVLVACFKAIKESYCE